MEGRSSPQHQHHGGHDAVEKGEPRNGGVVSPNLTTCHVYEMNATERISSSCVNCCPQKPLSSEPFSDFQFPDPSSPLRLRRPAHLVDAYYVAKYREAVSRMKSLPFEDPRNFYRQADVHCAYCTGAYMQSNSDSPLNIHKSWLFFPWHRMMLYFHERILGNLIGDDCFALPFWNYDHPDGMKIPEMYNVSGPLEDTNRDPSHIPYLVDLNFSLPDNKRRPPEEQEKANLDLMYIQMNANRTDLFMGFSKGPGALELAPHDLVHDWTGSYLNPRREDMGILYSAGRNPIFYAHHGNIDRLWEVWRELQMEKSLPSEINESAWLDSYFFFHDEKKQLVRIKIQDVLNITKLGYAYQKVDLPWNYTTSKEARDRLKMTRPDLEPGNSSAVFEPPGKILDTTIAVQVDRRHKQKHYFKEEEVLVVYGIDVKEDIYVRFDVFVSIVVVNGTSKADPHFIDFAGIFVNLPHGAGPVMRRKTILKLGISGLLQDLRADEDDRIWVTLIPRLNGMKVSIDGIRIE